MSPTITVLRARAVNAPLLKPHKTASGTVEAAPLVLVDLETNDGLTGSAYVFVYTPHALRPTVDLLQTLSAIVAGLPADPAHVSTELESRFRLLGVQGLVGIALAAIDMALWDAAAKRAKMPLHALFGAECRAIPAYNSLGQMPPDETAREVEDALALGFTAFKIKAGHANPDTDAAVIAAIRQVAGPETWVAADFNQAFSVDEAVERMKTLDGLNLGWVEEPVLAEDLNGHAQVREAIRTPVQTGENWWGPAGMANALAAGACDRAMPDVMKIGGVTGWGQAIDLAADYGLPVSSHTFIEVSAHLLTATPTAHRLEWLDVAGAINRTPPTVEQGQVTASAEPGIGLNWDEDAIEQYAIAV